MFSQECQPKYGRDWEPFQNMMALQILEAHSDRDCLSEQRVTRGAFCLHVSEALKIEHSVAPFCFAGCVVRYL